jgi:hypothetical protein
LVDTWVDHQRALSHSRGITVLHHKFHSNCLPGSTKLATLHRHQQCMRSHHDCKFRTSRRGLPCPVLIPQSVALPTELALIAPGVISTAKPQESSSCFEASAFSDSREPSSHCARASACTQTGSGVSLRLPRSSSVMLTQSVAKGSAITARVESLRKSWENRRRSTPPNSLLSV